MGSETDGSYPLKTPLQTPEVLARSGRIPLMKQQSCAQPMTPARDSSALLTVACAHHMISSRVHQCLARIIRLACTIIQTYPPTRSIATAATNTSKRMQVTKRQLDQLSPLFILGEMTLRARHIASIATTRVGRARSALLMISQVLALQRQHSEWRRQEATVSVSESQTFRVLRLKLLTSLSP